MAWRRLKAAQGMQDARWWAGAAAGACLPQQSPCMSRPLAAVWSFFVVLHGKDAYVRPTLFSEPKVVGLARGSRRPKIEYLKKRSFPPGCPVKITQVGQRSARKKCLWTILYHSFYRATQTNEKQGGMGLRKIEGTSWAAV